MGDSWIITVPNEALTPQAAFDRIKAETGHLAEVHRFEIPMHALQVGTLDSLMVRPRRRRRRRRRRHAFSPIAARPALLAHSP